MRRKVLLIWLTAIAAVCLLFCALLHAGLNRSSRPSAEPAGDEVTKAMEAEAPADVDGTPAGRSPGA